MEGHAVECRIYAEDPRDNFLPSTGTLTKHRIPSGNGVRVDSGVEEGQEITINYDPMISKLCTYGNDRQHAIKRMLRALDEYEIAGCRTTIPFCKYVLTHDSFASGDYDTHFVPDHFSAEKLDAADPLKNEVKALAAALLKLEDEGQEETQELKQTSTNGVYSKWWKQRTRK